MRTIDPKYHSLILIRPVPEEVLANWAAVLLEKAKELQT